MREDFQRFWTYKGAHWAGRFLDEWCTRAMRSKIGPMKKMARTLRGHRELLLNWFRAKGEYSSGCVEGLNGKAKLAMKKAYGFKSHETIEIALYHQLGRLSVSHLRPRHRECPHLVQPQRVAGQRDQAIESQCDAGAFWQSVLHRA